MLKKNNLFAMNFSKAIFVSVFLLLCFNGFTQKISVGIQPTMNIGFFNLEDKEQLNNVSLRNHQRYTLGGSVIIAYQVTPNFSVSLKNNFSHKQIQFLASTENTRNDLRINYYAYDISFAGRFHLPIKNWVLIPELGVGMSINKSDGWLFKSSLNSTGNVGVPITVSTPVPNFGELGPEKVFVNPAATIGLSIQPAKSKSFEVNTNFFYTPINFFKDDITIPFTAGDLLFKGKYQYASLGLTFFLR